MTEDTLLDWLTVLGSWLVGNALALAQMLAALVTAAATFALWRATRALAAETTTLAKMTERPFVVCWLESSGASPVAMNLTLRNTGNATAFDIKLKLSPALPKPNENAPDNLEETTFEISLLPPGQLLSVQGVMTNEVHDKAFSTEVSWARKPKSAEREILSYRFKPKDGFRGGWNTKSGHDIAEELAKIRKQLAKS